MENRPPSPIIKRIDQYLLKNFPVTWSSRIHTAGLYGLGFSLLIAFISFIVPNDPRSSPNVHYWIMLIVILSLLAFIFWMIYLLRFNVFKRFGTWKSTDTLKTFLLYFTVIVIIHSWPFIPPVIESVRANAAYSSEELAADVNSMNIKICQLEQDSINTRFKRDTFEVDNSVVRFEKRANQYYNNGTVTIDVANIDNYYFIDTASLRDKLTAADSVKKLNDSVYVTYDCPDYTFIDNYSLDARSKIKLMTDMDIYRQVLQYKQAIDREKVRTELGRLFRKYSPDHDPATLSAGLSTNNYGENSYLSKIMDKYDTYELNQRVENITDKKYRWDKETFEISWRVLYYFTISLAMLVLVYRHTTRRTFFLSLLSAVVLLILSSLLIAMAPHSGNESVFHYWVIGYFILFAGLSAFIFTNRYRNVISGIALNLLVFMTPFMPLVITSMYYKSLKQKTRYTNWEEYQYFENEELHVFLSEMGGALLLVLLLATVYQMAYKKWFSSPEQ